MWQLVRRDEVERHFAQPFQFLLDENRTVAESGVELSVQGSDMRTYSPAGTVLLSRRWTAITSTPTSFSVSRIRCVATSPRCATNLTRSLPIWRHASQLQTLRNFLRMTEVQPMQAHELRVATDVSQKKERPMRLLARRLDV